MTDTSSAPALSLFSKLSETDRERLQEAIQRLLAQGSILRDEPGQREIYEWSRNNAQWLDDLANLLGLRLVWEHESRLIQAVPQTPVLLRRLRLDESLVCLALWYDYDVAVRDQGAHQVVLTVREFNEKLGSKFNNLKLPSESRMREILRLFERKNLVRVRLEAEFAGSSIQILPTIRFAIPFPNIEEWNRQRTRYVQGAVGEQAGETTGDVTDESSD